MNECDQIRLVGIKMNDDGVSLSNIIIVIIMKCKSFLFLVKKGRQRETHKTSSKTRKLR